jgi:hypothetical protein
MAEVCPPCERVERHLRWRRAHAPECVDDGAIELAGKVARLVEAAPHPPPRMKRDRHHAISVVED